MAYSQNNQTKEGYGEIKVKNKINLLPYVSSYKIKKQEPVVFPNISSDEEFLVP